MCTVIAVANQKGGVAKTTTAQTLCAGLADRGYRVLGIDVDSQFNFSKGLNISGMDVPTTYEILKGKSSIQDAIQTVTRETGNFDVVPSNILLAGAESELLGRAGREYALRDAVAPVMDQYDWIILDTPPALSLLTINAFALADEILVPCEADIYAIVGFAQLRNTVDSVRKYCNPKVKICGILITKFDTRTSVDTNLRELAIQIGSHMNVPVYNTIIRKNSKVKEAPTCGQDIFIYSKRSNGAKDYNAFIDEFLKNRSEK